jgi:hypothetical protein
MLRSTGLRYGQCGQSSVHLYTQRANRTVAGGRGNYIEFAKFLLNLSMSGESDV